MLGLRRASGVCAVALTLTAAVAVPAMAAQHDSAGGREYYVAFGDSLSVGSQPNAQGAAVLTNEGYTNQLYNSLLQSNPDLLLAELGCPGETSATLVNGGLCGYSGDQRLSLNGNTSSQLAAALAFIAAHPGQVPLITLDIGANDVHSCLGLGTVAATFACMSAVYPTLERNLSDALTQPRAADPQATIVGMTYYLPQLAYWLNGPGGQADAEENIPPWTQFNQVLTTAYQQAGVSVADVFTAFRTTDITSTMTVPGIGTVPVDVGLICEWTWQCTSPPQGPNPHANTTGYGVIAQTFLSTLYSAGYQP